MSAANALGLGCERRFDLTLSRDPEYDMYCCQANKDSYQEAGHGRNDAKCMVD